MFERMRNFRNWILFSSLLVGSVGCHDDLDDESGDGADSNASKAAPRLIEQVPPPLDLKTPPADAAKTASGLIYKTLVANAAGAQPKRNETALIQYTGWRQRTGETFFTTKGRGQPIALDIAHAAPGFAEALPLLHKGEKAVLWMPSSPGTPEPLVYEVEIVDVVSPPVAKSSQTPPPTKR